MKTIKHNTNQCQLVNDFFEVLQAAGNMIVQFSWGHCIGFEHCKGALETCDRSVMNESVD